MPIQSCKASVFLCSQSPLPDESSLVCLFSSGREGARCSHSNFRDPSKSACRQMWRSACRRCHPCRQQHQSARCQTQGGSHNFVPTGNTDLHTHKHTTPRCLSESAHSRCPCQRGQIEFEVVYVAPEVDSDDENVEYEDDSGHHYRLYLDELDDSSTAPPINSSASLQGEISKLVLTSNNMLREKGHTEYLNV